MGEEKESLDVIEEAQKQVKQHIELAMASYRRTVEESNRLKQEIAQLEQRQNRPYSGVPFKTHGKKTTNWIVLSVLINKSLSIYTKIGNKLNSGRSSFIGICRRNGGTWPDRVEGSWGCLV